MGHMTMTHVLYVNFLDSYVLNEISVYAYQFKIWFCPQV